MAGISNSIIIVNFNAKPALLTHLRSLKMEEATSTEVIVVDNASFDGSAESVQEQFPRAKVLPMNSNRGFAAAANAGIDRAEGDIVILCHADIIADIHTLAELADQAREAEGRKVMAVLPQLVGVDDAPQPFVGNFPGLGRALAGAINPPAGLKCRVPTLDHLAPGEWARFVCVAINTSCLTTLGMLDDKFFLYGADTDFCSRLHGKQMRVLISKDVKVTHAGSAIDKTLPSHLMRLLRKDQQQYVKKHLPGWQQGIVGMLSKLGKGDA
jgi:N-acetylglucosaminyl-diphospho-decaprenol L-rhamnosyltransferase